MSAPKNKTTARKSRSQSKDVTTTETKAQKGKLQIQNSPTTPKNTRAGSRLINSEGKAQENKMATRNQSGKSLSNQKVPQVTEESISKK